MTPGQYDDLIDRWHAGEGGSLELYEFLGMTPEEFREFGRDERRIPDRPTGYRAVRGEDGQWRFVMLWDPPPKLPWRDRLWVARKSWQARWTVWREDHWPYRFTSQWLERRSLRRLRIRRVKHMIFGYRLSALIGRLDEREHRLGREESRLCRFYDWITR